MKMGTVKELDLVLAKCKLLNSLKSLKEQTCTDIFLFLCLFYYTWEANLRAPKTYFSSRNIHKNIIENSPPLELVT